MAKQKNQRASDHYTQRAKKEGYPARSVYKLEEIQQKFQLFRPGMRILDIGAAPGSWTLYLHRKMLKGKGGITAVDLKELGLNPLPSSVTFFKGDAFADDVRRRISGNGPFDAVISDAAPATTGNRTVDTARSEQLAEDVLALACEELKPGGSLVIKVFQGGAEQQLLQEMRSRFSKVKPFKPKASRSESFEVFLIGLTLKAEQQRP